MQVDAAAEGAGRPQQAEALAEDRSQVVLGDVLADVRAGDEVDGLARQPGSSRVAGSQVLDPEALLELPELVNDSLSRLERALGRMSTSTCRPTPSDAYESGIARSQPTPNS